MSAIGKVSVKDTPQIVQTHHTAAVELIKLIEHKFATTQVITTSSSRPVAKLDMLVCATTRCHHCNSRSHNQAAHVHDHQCRARMVYVILALPPYTLHSGIDLRNFTNLVDAPDVHLRTELRRRASERWA